MRRARTDLPVTPPFTPRAVGGRTGLDCSRPERARGFTLIELVIGIAIAAALFGAVVMGVGSITGAKAKEAAGELSAAIRMMYDEAALSGRTCRIVFSLPSQKDDEDAQVSWRAECANKGVTSSRNREEELEAANEAERDRQKGGTAGAAEAISQRSSRDFDLNGDPSLEDILGAEKAAVDDAVKFSDFTSPLIEPAQLPSSVRVSVWTRMQRDPVDEGVAYLYFYPQGYTERAMVFVTQGDNEWTIKVSPLTGKTEILPEREEVPR